MVNMVPHEAFACSCVEGDVVLRQSYKPESCGPSTPSNYSSGPSTPPSYSSGPSTPPNYSSRSSRKCRVLKLQALAWKDKCTQGNNEYAYAYGATHN
nr:hypothetical protein [Tanacetum cinerariifolium]